MREFIVNLPTKMDDPSSPHFQKVHVRGKCIEFSPIVIKDFFGRVPFTTIDPMPSKPSLVEEIIGEKDKKGWPAKGFYRASKLSSKYSILHDI